MRVHPLARFSSGFTLVELMIAVVVAGVLLAVALPSFMDSVRKGRRTEAYTALSALQQAQERHRSGNPNYVSSLTTLGLNATTATGRYAISIISASATGYEIAADGTGSNQAGDGNCARLGILSTGAALRYASCRSCTAFVATDYQASNACWNQ